MRKIPLGGQLGAGKFALIDDEDYELVSQYKWSLAQRGKREYAMARNGVIMHRLVMGVEDRSQDIDHINHDGLDNRRANLRACTRSENNMNSRSRKGSSQFKGVCRYKDSRWQANIWINRKQIYLGHFDQEVEAAKAYDEKARELYGSFACLNFEGVTNG